MRQPSSPSSASAHAGTPAHAGGTDAALSAPAERGVTRRAVLRSSCLLAAGGAALAGVGVSSAACTVGGSTEPDPLIALRDDAESDAALATALIRTHTDLTPQLTTIADERRAHADALEEEVRRVAGGTSAAPTTADTSPTAAAPPSESGRTDTGPTQTGPPPALNTLRTSLAGSSRAATGAARTLSGYRAALTGSIGAACAAGGKVLLP